jgi:Protein of unknown function (DUF2802)
MITLNVNLALQILASALAICALSAVLSLAFSTRRLRNRCAAVEASLAATRRELEVMAAIGLRTGSRVNRMEREFSGVAERVESVELRGPAQCFDQAIDFARRGTDPIRLTQQFGLSRAEADLVTRLHGRKKTASAL